MKSRRGLLAAIALLLALPITVLWGMIVGEGTDIIIHFALAPGSILAATAVFDFKTPIWATWLGCIAAGGAGIIFLLQGMSHLIQNDAFTAFVYQVLGTWPELVLTDLFFVWCAVVVCTDSQGKLWLLGVVALLVVVCLEIARLVLSYQGGALSSGIPNLKALYLLPIIWLFFESKASTRRIDRMSLNLSPN